jgi:hypothetical protein
MTAGKFYFFLTGYPIRSISEDRSRIDQFCFVAVCRRCAMYFRDQSAWNFTSNLAQHECSSIAQELTAVSFEEVSKVEVRGRL